MHRVQGPESRGCTPAAQRFRLAKACVFPPPPMQRVSEGDAAEHGVAGVCDAVRPAAIACAVGSSLRGQAQRGADRTSAGPRRDGRPVRELGEAWPFSRRKLGASPGRAGKKRHQASRDGWVECQAKTFPVPGIEPGQRVFLRRAASSAGLWRYAGTATDRLRRHGFESLTTRDSPRVSSAD